MSGLAILIPIALAMGALGLLVFFWAMRSGQFEDLDGAAQRILIDDDDAPESTSDQGHQDDRPAQGPPDHP